MKLIVPTSHTIQYEDWEPLMQDIVDTHPGLRFLHDHKEFHTRYIKTVIARIYYTINRSWSGKITLTELKRSNFLSVLESLELEEDINLIKDYFSYEHFYVIYCKFWELDKDHDLFISKEDLYRHNNYGIYSFIYLFKIFSSKYSYLYDKTSYFSLSLSKTILHSHICARHRSHLQRHRDQEQGLSGRFDELLRFRVVSHLRRGQEESD